MMHEIWSKTFYGNTITEWAIAMVIIIATLVIGKVLYWVFKGVLQKLTLKTKTRLDDIILDMVEEPIVFALTIAGVWFGLRTLTFPEAFAALLSKGVKFLIMLSVTWLIARLFNAMFVHYLAPLAEKSENDLDDQLLPIVRKGTSMGVWSIGIIVALNNAGYDVGAVLAGLGIGGIALAMAAKDTVSNVFGGFTIFTDRPFTLNDRIRVSGFDGTIKEIGIRSTRLQTLAGTIVTIPNATFGGSAVENVSAEPSRKITTNLGLTYDMTPEKIEQATSILKEICSKNNSLEESVSVGFNGFGDFALNICLIYYIKKGEDILGTQNDVNLEILKRFNGDAIDMAFPTQTIYRK